MFRSICTKFLHANNLYTSKHGHGCCSSLQKFCSIPTNQDTPTVSYLINKCGFSLDPAISLSQKIHIQTTDGPDSVLQFLKSYGFTQSQITTTVTRFPRILFSDPINTLKPKFEFFKSIGLSRADIGIMVCSNVNIVQRSLENQLTPAFNFLKTFFTQCNLSNPDTISALVRTRFIVNRFAASVKPKIAFLQNHGIPDHNIGRLLITNPRAFTSNSDKFKEIFWRVDDMQFDRNSTSFLLALGVMISIGDSLWLKKVEAYKNFGWSEEDVITSFKMQPNLMNTSEEKIRKMMEFYLNELGLAVSDVTEHPNLMLISFEKRVIPRCSVLQILLLNGLTKTKLSVLTALVVAKNEFERKYIEKYKEELPDVLRAYEGVLPPPRFDALRTIMRSVD